MAHSLSMRLCYRNRQRLLPFPGVRRGLKGLPGGQRLSGLPWSLAALVGKHKFKLTSSNESEKAHCRRVIRTAQLVGLGKPSASATAIQAHPASSRLSDCPHCCHRGSIGFRVAAFTKSDITRSAIPRRASAAIFDCRRKLTRQSFFSFHKVAFVVRWSTCNHSHETPTPSSIRLSGNAA